MKAPKVSIIMSVFNDTEHLDSAIQSILNQSFNDFEFLIVDDGSTNKEVNEKLQQYNDIRVVVHTLNENQGLPNALNFLLNKAKGEYIARMDADDISLPSRLEKQVQYLDLHNNLDIVACNIKRIGASEQSWVIPNNDHKIKTQLLWSNAIAHPTVMFRISSFQEKKIQYDNLRYAQDYELWTRCATQGICFGSIDETLLLYRVPNTTNSTKKTAQRKNSHEISRKYIEKAFNKKLTDHEHNLLTGNFSRTIHLVDWYKLIKNMHQIVPDYMCRSYFIEHSLFVLNKKKSNRINSLLIKKINKLVRYKFNP